MSRRPVAFLEIGALFEEHWTGIPNVAAAIAQDGMCDTTIDWHFVYDNIVIPHDVIASFITQRSGAGGLAALADIAWNNHAVTRKTARNAACVFPNIKPVRRFFEREASIVHDLSAIVTPQFHNADTIIHVANRIRSDIDTSDHIFCVSSATMQDVKSYFQVEEERLSVLPLGVDLDPVHLSVACGVTTEYDAEPYVVVVGTLEPRKNGRIVLEYLASNPDFLERFRVVFIGRDGWLDEKARLLDVVRRAGVPADRVVFTGFISEAEKITLILHSAFCIYPSFFEGFGLPILEASALGKLTVCSNSSSMPEVAPEDCIFFNPLSKDELDDALTIAERRSAQTRSSARALPDIMRRADAVSWRRCYPEIARWILQR